MLWSARPEGAVDYSNRPWLEFTATTPELAEGWGWAAAIYPDDRDGLMECWRSCLASGTPFDMEARMRRFDGAYRWFIFRANPLQDASGKILRWFGTNIDIEDRKRRVQTSSPFRRQNPAYPYGIGFAQQRSRSVEKCVSIEEYAPAREGSEEFYPVTNGKPPDMRSLLQSDQMHVALNRLYHRVHPARKHLLGHAKCVTLRSMEWHMRR